MHTPARRSCCRPSATSRSTTTSPGLRRLPAPAGRGQLLRRRACCCPRHAPCRTCTRPRHDRELSVEDLRDVFSVSYEMAAHRFTNLATHHLDLPVHFVRNDESGIDLQGVRERRARLPRRRARARSRASACAGEWAGRQVFPSPDRFSVYYQYTDTPDRHVLVPRPRRPRRASGDFAITLGVPFEHSRWFRGRDTNRRVRSPARRRLLPPPPAELAQRWEGYAWPSARAHSHVLAVLPPGAFPGVDESERVRVPGPARVELIAERKGTGAGATPGRDMAARPHELRGRLAAR